MFSATYARATLVGNRVTRVTNLWFKLRRRGFNRSKPFYFTLVNQIAGEMIHAVCSYYICTFFICMN